MKQHRESIKLRVRALKFERRKDETVLSAFCQDQSQVDGVFTGNP